MIYEWFMVICLYAYVASSLSKALPLWRLRRRAAPVFTPSSSSSKLATFMASVPQQKSPIAEPAPRTTSRLAEFVAAVPNR